MVTLFVVALQRRLNRGFFVGKGILALLNQGMNLPHAKSQRRKEKKFLNTLFFHFILQFSNAGIFDGFLSPDSSDN
ncbi:MAG: hypothetical protein DSM106950_02925 [Stigonema ocellatum SAG 48.90 = DSM 106950]|nr:hypothetical protein [Stigonema ocellatum SAG 48.90 = DSM 106950]